MSCALCCFLRSAALSEGRSSMLVKNGSGWLRRLSPGWQISLHMTYSNLGSKIPLLRCTVLSHASATSAKILDSALGFSCMTPSQMEIPNFIDSFVKVWNGIPTKKWIIEGCAPLLLHRNAAAFRSASRISSVETSTPVDIDLAIRARIPSTSWIAS
jgi:hypothetical protein